MNNTPPLSRRSLTDAYRHTQTAVEDRSLNGTRIFMFAYLRILVSLLCVLCGLGVSIFAQDWKPIHDGVEYARVDHQIGRDPVKINLLRLDLKKVRLDVHHAFDKAIGVEPTSAIAKRHGAIAAINAGFFRLDKSEFAGDAAGILMIDGVLWSESHEARATLIIGDGEKESLVDFAHYSTESWLHMGSEDPLSSIQLSGINRERKKGEAVVYQSGQHPIPARGSGDIEIWLGNCRTKKVAAHSDHFLKCDRLAVIRDDSVPRTPSNEQFVISMEKEFVSKNGILTMPFLLEQGGKKRIFIRTHIQEGDSHFNFSGAFDITNGVPQLIKNGNIDITWQEERASKSFVEMRHPRTAVAKLKGGKFLMITVDGRQPGVSVGMNLHELAEYILSLGATDAMNLDGGGSTTMYIDGQIVNTPSDKEGERKVSDAILVTLRKKARRRN